MDELKRQAWILMGRPKLKLGKLIRVTPGGRHAYYESEIGPVRKELQGA